MDSLGELPLACYFEIVCHKPAIYDRALKTVVKNNKPFFELISKIKNF